MTIPFRIKTKHFTIKLITLFLNPIGDFTTFTFNSFLGLFLKCRYKFKSNFNPLFFDMHKRRNCIQKSEIIIPYKYKPVASFAFIRNSISCILNFASKHLLYFRKNIFVCICDVAEVSPLNMINWPFGSQNVNSHTLMESTRNRGSTFTIEKASNIFNRRRIIHV